MERLGYVVFPGVSKNLSQSNVSVQRVHSRRVSVWGVLGIAIASQILNTTFRAGQQSMEHLESLVNESATWCKRDGGVSLVVQVA